MPHLATAIATDTSCVVLSLPRIGLDIDTPEDLQQLASAPGGKPSQVLARELLQTATVAGVANSTEIVSAAER
jgi:2-phospho-L-lactate guanylyltransferase (CobY/MobA/RfbA family)